MPEIPAGYEIGSAHPHELAELPGIEVAAAAIFPPEDVAPQLREECSPLSFFEQASSSGRLWVARTMNPAVPVGFAAAILLDGSAHLQEIDVLPSHQGQGLGRALLLSVARWARRSGFAFLTLTTFRHLSWNAPFYASVGFAEVPAQELAPELRAVLEEEAVDGLDPSKRVAMRLDLRSA